MKRSSTIRNSFSKIKTPPMPHLLAIQLESYRKFLQADVEPTKREKIGLEAVFRSVFPITDFSNTATLDYVSYRVEAPQFTVEECRVRGVTYSAPLRVTFRLLVWDRNGEGKEGNIQDIKEQEVFLGEMPLMTDYGSFIINGSNRVVVSQMHKSSGVFFTREQSKSTTSDGIAHSARIVPQRGSWIDFEFDSKDLLHVRLDRRHRFYATVLLKALGYTTEDIINRYYDTAVFYLNEAHGQEAEERRFYRSISDKTSLNIVINEDVIDEKSNKVLVHADRLLNRAALRRLTEAGIQRISCTVADIVGQVSSKAVHDKNGDVLVPANGVITEEILEELLDNGIDSINTLHMGDGTIGRSLHETLVADGIATTDEALLDFYRHIKPSDMPSVETAKQLLHNQFFNEERYSLSRVGRLKINRKFGFDDPLDNVVLTHADILETVGYLLRFREGLEGTPDDIDHLGNRRVRSVGELLENQYRIGLVRLERTIRDRLVQHSSEKSVALQDMVTSKPVSATINEFFGSSQLSQFMDQTNPLSEVTHKRRLSALGPGGLSREWAGFDVRDVHTSHYGRICPIETPEGPNIGLIASLSTYAQINEFGFIETPYHRVTDGKVTENLQYLAAIDEDEFKIAQANAPLTDEMGFRNELVSSRHGGEFEMTGRDEIHYMDVAPHQLVSAAASLIPFLEHDDANRALMGSNMQRQAVPLISPSAPLVGTGMEGLIASDSGACVVAKRSGVVERVDSGRIVISADEDTDEDQSNGSAPSTNVDIYRLSKYTGSNQSICINQRPIVSLNQRVVKGQVIADGVSCDNGELALGQNILVAFLPWNGYNFEDSILISERVVREDMYTSIHIEEYEVVARDAKLGKELITRDIPNAGEEALKHLDDSGIIRVGAYVKTGDILVGKTTPKGEAQLNPEEKLLRAIFGDKAGDVRDTSLRTPQGIEGVVIDAVVFNRMGLEKDERTLEIEKQQLSEYEKDFEDELRVIRSNLIGTAEPYLVGKKLLYDVVEHQGTKVIYPEGTTIEAGMLHRIPLRSWHDVKVDGKDSERVTRLTKNALAQIEDLEKRYKDRCDKAVTGVELPPGIIRIIKVYIAVKRRLSVGDKMAGRHGNKGVVSRIEAMENMPYMEDGTPIDIVLSPLGVPSRMNVGQVLETHLGWAARQLGRRIEEMHKNNTPLDNIRKFVGSICSLPEGGLDVSQLSDEELVEASKSMFGGVKFASPVFDGAREADIQKLLEYADCSTSGQTRLYDGLTGEIFDNPVTVGYIYMLKLHHLVDDKIHARSIGPYSLVTQQPLGGKAQFGGQRFGEMEVWALEAYGAAYTLQELLTVKSDDITGRNRIYESIIKGNYVLEAGIPESFKVLSNELKSLCLNLKLIKD